MGYLYHFDTPRHASVVNRTHITDVHLCPSTVHVTTISVNEGALVDRPMARIMGIWPHHQRFIGFEQLGPSMTSTATGPAIQLATANPDPVFAQTPTPRGRRAA